MSHCDINSLLKNYQLPTPLGFGQEMAPVMYRADYTGGQWQTGELLPFGKIGINPAATSVQFAQQAFEGMKAYQAEHPYPVLFRPEMNFHRLNRSATRLCMPLVPSELFADALATVTNACQPFIPRDSGQSLYLSPTLLGTGTTFAVKSSDTFTFILIASPCDAYYADPIQVMIERSDCRAAVGGTGADKVGGNYATSLQSTHKCIKLGYDQPLWLDSLERRNIEELSGMNFMAVIDGALNTPMLSGSILPGVTRNTLIALAKQQKIEVIERTMPIDELLKDIESTRCSEIFACGTGAIVCPISTIGEDNGDKFILHKVDVVAAKLKSILLDIQEGRSEDSLDWLMIAGDRAAIQRRLER